jgi:hypothetical protein
LYEATRKSLIKFATVQAGLINASLGTTLSYSDFDSHGDQAALPSSDLVGLHSFEMENQTQFHVTTFGLMISSYDDPNLLIQTRYLDWFYKLLGFGDLIPLYDPTTAAQIGNMIMLANTRTFPVERADTRAAAFILSSAKVIVNPTP